MTIWLLAYFGGLLTILSPCILPVLPFVFSHADVPFKKSGLPLLIGMALTFSLLASLAVVGGEWVVRANEWGRWIALALLTLFAFSLLSPSFAEHLTSPFTRLGGRLTNQIGQERSFGKSFGLGIATGLLWAPCAGPILGIILTGAALNGASVSTSILLLAYALGAATSLGLALLAGGKMFQIMKRYLGADRWVRKFLGVAVLVGVASIALGFDRGILTKISKVSTEGIERKLIGVIAPKMPEAKVEGAAPELNGVVGWINSKPLSLKDLKGKVVLIDFWTYSCINCLRTLPYVKEWARKYQDQGLVVIGVHTPEFAFEKVISNVQRAVGELGVTYPVAIDNNYAVWKAFDNNYWPAHYFIDKEGIIRHHHFGEGSYSESEAVIQKLLGLQEGQIEKDKNELNISEVLSPETYIGSDRSENRVNNPQGKKLERNQWGLSGDWITKSENATLTKSGGKIIFRFHARDLYLVLGLPEGIQSTRFKVTINGKPPGKEHGPDVNAAGEGVVKEHRLYQLIRQKGSIQDRTFEIEFDGAVEAFAFTFGS